MSPVKRTSHAVYDLKYHFVWIPKYRKRILNENIAKRVEEIFREIAEIYEFEIETMAVVEDHVHVFLSAPPKYAPGEVVRILKSRSAKMVFKEFPQVRRELWAGELWSDGYFVTSVGDQVTTEIIRRYIEYHNTEQLAFDF
ncbi:MAG TPA: IS200/IS605 family transposase [Thermodesulfobacteriota bacterium]|nr:IS200/IS605 family transposase [Thermodesulfobacteriota bacterium]